MDIRRFYIFLIDLKVPFESDDAPLYVILVKNGKSSRLALHSSVSVSGSLDSPVTFNLCLTDDIVGSTTLPLKDVTGEHSVSTPQGPVSLVFETNFWDASSQNTSYLNDIHLSQGIHNDIESALESLRNKPGDLYTRILTHKVKRIQKSTPKKKTPKLPPPEDPVAVSSTHFSGSLDKLSCLSCQRSA